MNIRQYLWAMVVILGWVSVAQASITPPPAQKEVTVLTADDLQAFAMQALVDAGAGEGIAVSLMGQYPDVLYQHPQPFVVDIRFQQLDRTAQQFAAVAQLVTTESAEVLGQPFNLKGRYSHQLEVPVVNRRLSRDDVITDADISYVAVEEHRLRDDTILDADEMIGMSPRRLVSPNRPLRSRELEKPALIHKGEAVTMYFKTPYMELKTTGEAMRDGAQGEVIGVRNTESFQTVKGVVASAGMVRVMPGFTQAIGESL